MFALPLRRRSPRARSLVTTLLAALAVTAPGCGPGGIALYDHEVVNTYPHDPLAYTQGLLFANGMLYESTGRMGQSGVRRVALETGRVEKERSLPYSLFGEGLALHGDELIQLTWTSQAGHVFDAETFEVRRKVTYEGEGWGITSDGTHLIMSNGTDLLSFRDPETFAEVNRLRVKAAGRPVYDLNELEYIDGEIWANLWKKDWLARIDPKTGEVVGWVDLTGIFDTSTLTDPEGVLNGIAWDAVGRRLFVTGKLWPYLFEITIAERASSSESAAGPSLKRTPRLR